jgi:PAS domain S-box-containing protein
MITGSSHSSITAGSRGRTRRRIVERLAGANGAPSLSDPGEAALEALQQQLRVMHAQKAELELQMKALREEGEFYRNIVQTAEEGIWRINAQSLTDYVNPKMAQMMGYTPEEMLGRPIDDFLDKAGRVELAKLINRRKGGIAEQFEFQYLRKDGSKLWAFVSTNPILNAGGEYTGSMALLTDIGERKAMEQELAHTADLLARTGEMAKIGGWELDLASGTLFLSAETRRLFEVPDSATLSLEDAVAFYAPEAQPKIQAGIDAAIKQGKSYDLELRVITATGRSIWTRSQGSPVRKGRRAVRLIGTFQDITERKEAELKYRRELEFNQTLVNHTATIILLLDREGRVVHVNDATVHLLGYSRPQLLGRTLWEVGIMGPEQETIAAGRIQRLMTGGTNQPYETRLRAKDGRHRLFTLSCIATRLPDGGIDRIILTGADLTERNRLQRELLNISEREQARIGHNLHDGVGQTLTGVASLVEVLEGEVDERQRASAARIRELIQHAIHEVRHLSHGMSPAAVKNRGLGGVLQLLADSLRGNHRTECHFEIEPGIQIGDEEKESHLYRIAQEACSNAVRHGRATQVSLSLRRVGEREGLMQIDDNGTGLSGTKTRAEKGIGLQVMDYRANLIGGTLEITSQPQRGVSVCCRFPCAADHPQALASDV